MNFDAFFFSDLVRIVPNTLLFLLLSLSHARSNFLYPPSLLHSFHSFSSTTTILLFFFFFIWNQDVSRQIYINIILCSKTRILMPSSSCMRMMCVCVCVARKTISQIFIYLKSSERRLQQTTNEEGNDVDRLIWFEIIRARKILCW